MGQALRQHPTGFTYAADLVWPEGERWALIDGRAYAISPAPSNFHQLVVGALFRHVAKQFHGKPLAFPELVVALSVCRRAIA